MNVIEIVIGIEIAIEIETEIVIEIGIVMTDVFAVEEDLIIVQWMREQKEH